jgi:beta-galactosidase
LRGDGEVRLLQQALNFQEAHNDNLTTPAFADGIWVMFDYNRGYAPDIESSGVMDIFRLPKFSCWFFRSQRDPTEIVGGQPVGPTIFIANYWTTNSPRDVRVFSNCEEVALHLNGKLIERRRPDTSRFATHLKHAPFTFNLDHFEPGTLHAIAYISGREVATHQVKTPAEPAEMKMRFDLSGRPFAAAGKDAIFCHVEFRDTDGVSVPAADARVFFGTTGSARIVGAASVRVEAGIATALLESDTAKPICTVYALSLVNDHGRIRIVSTAASPDGSPVAELQVRYTTDGTTPSTASPLYSSPLPSSTQLRAAIIVQGATVATADSRARAASTHELAETAPNSAAQ